MERDNFNKNISIWTNWKKSPRSERGVLWIRVPLWILVMVRKVNGEWEMPKHWKRKHGHLTGHHEYVILQKLVGYGWMPILRNRQDLIV